MITRTARACDGSGRPADHRRSRATATGKSGLALDLGERLDGEVINADAMRLYRGMDIGTASLAPKERRAIPHHQLDVLEVTEEASAAVYQESARRDIAAIRRRGHVPILVGGSGLYVRAALTGSRSHRPTLPCVAASRRRRPALGADSMYRLLLQRDPAAAAQIQPANLRRIVRALEVIEPDRPTIQRLDAESRVRCTHGRDRVVRGPVDPGPAHRCPGGADVARWSGHRG